MKRVAESYYKGEPMRTELLPEDAADAVRRWDAGEVVWTIEMGGLGPGYEQCLQVMVVEMLRVAVRENLSKTDYKGFAFAQDERLKDVVRHLGPSGAQWSAALNLAWGIFARGYAALAAEVPFDRWMQVSKTWPQLSGTGGSR